MIKIDSIILIFAGFFSIITQAWRYDLTTYNKFAASKFETSPNLFFLEEFQESVSQRIVLKDGRVVNCKIPLNMDVELSNQDEEEQVEETISGLTNETVLNYLDVLHNQCALYRTKEFLWEYCFRKYFKQYDDQETMKNANKPGRELFYLGYYQYYNNFTNTTTSNYSFTPSTSMYNSFIIPEQNISTLYIQGQIVKIKKNHAIVSRQQSCVLILWFNRDLLSSYYLDILDQYTVNQTNKSELILKIKRVINNYLSILETTAPFDIITTNFSLTCEYDYNINRDLNQINVYKQFIYSNKLNAYTKYEKGDTIAVLYDNAMFISQIYRIWHSNLIELVTLDQLEYKNDTNYQRYDQRLYKFNFSSNEDEEYAINIVLLDRFNSSKYVWQTGQTNKICMAGSIATIQERGFVPQDLKKGDVIMILKFNSKISEDYLIKKAIKKSPFILLKKQFLPQSWHEESKYETYRHSNGCGYYLYGRMKQSIQQQTITTQVDQFLKINTVGNPGWRVPEIISFQLDTQNKANLDYINIDSFELPNVNDGLISFYLGKVNPNNFFSFKMLLTNSRSNTEGIEISILDNENLYIKKTNMKNQFSQKNKFFFNSSITNKNLWIVVHKGEIRIGLSKVIGTMQQYLNFTYDDKSLEIKVIRFMGQYCQNVQLKNVFIQSVNYYLKKTLEKIAKRPLEEHYQFSELQYTEAYTDGDICTANKKPRQTTVSFSCSDTLFGIEQITEPSLCNYYLKIGTNLLCKKQKIVKNFNKVDNIQCVMDD